MNRIKRLLGMRDGYLDLTIGIDSKEVTMQDLYENLEYHGMKIVKKK